MGTACRVIKADDPVLASCAPSGCGISARLTVVGIVTSLGHGPGDGGLTFSLVARKLEGQGRLNPLLGTLATLRITPEARAEARHVVPPWRCESQAIHAVRKLKSRSERRSAHECGLDPVHPQHVGHDHDQGNLPPKAVLVGTPASTIR